MIEVNYHKRKNQELFKSLEEKNENSEIKKFFDKAKKFWEDLK